MSCYCGHGRDEHMEVPPWTGSPEVSPDGVLICAHSNCPCMGYDPID